MELSTTRKDNFNGIILSYSVLFLNIVFNCFKFATFRKEKRCISFFLGFFSFSFLCIRTLGSISVKTSNRQLNINVWEAIHIWGKGCMFHNQARFHYYLPNGTLYDRKKNSSFIMITVWYKFEKKGWKNGDSATLTFI